MDITNATENVALIRAIRIAYRVAWLLPQETAAEYVRTLARAWKAADRQGCLVTLAAIAWELGETVGTWEAWNELRMSMPVA
jgi:hypothetical protein